MFEIKGKFNTAKVFANHIDETTIGQIMELCNQEWAKDCNIAIMPDTHAGKGCTIGTTMTVHGKICPNLIGVDIGCGMLTVQIPRELGEISLEKLDKYINSQIPSGFDVNEKRICDPALFGLHLEKLNCFSELKNKDQLELAIGSLGGGNHFIELDKDNNENLYLVIHTGSRNLGKQVAEHYQDIAFEDCNKSKANKQKELNDLISKLKNEGRQKEIQNAIQEFNKNYRPTLTIQKDLCFLEGDHANDYLHDMLICQHFAHVNRVIIARRILDHLFKEKYQNGFGAVQAYFNKNKLDGFVYKDKTNSVQINTFETVHNYINMDDNILRKGAISAKEGEKVLVPINMRDGAIIGSGKGNPMYNFSGPHGAGRLMSRAEAKEKVSLTEFQNSMEGIYSSSVVFSTIDESPMAYKPMDEILQNIEDTIDVLQIVKPIYNFKAH